MHHHHNCNHLKFKQNNRSPAQWHFNVSTQSEFYRKFSIKTKSECKKKRNRMQNNNKTVSGKSIFRRALDDAQMENRKMFTERPLQLFCLNLFWNDEYWNGSVWKTRLIIQLMEIIQFVYSLLWTTPIFLRFHNYYCFKLIISHFSTATWLRKWKQASRLPLSAQHV